jgi:hypothetical protein
LTATSTVVRDPSRITGSLFDLISSTFFAEIVDIFGLFGALGDMFTLLAKG